ncbi:MAG: hypothetical protein OXG13_11675 [Gemmatimonadaceae bacterium]|nr:hypothetical protein [Gemmatimonadaceae bacterium]
MRSMRILTVVLLGLVACGGEEPAGSELSASEKALLGTWEIVNDSGIEGTVRLTFRADGTFELFIEGFGLSALTSGTYEVDGDRLRLDARKNTLVDEDGDEMEVTSEELVEGDLSGTYEIEGDTLYITFTEVGEDGKEAQVTAEYRRA